MSLEKQLRARRETWVTVGGFEFGIRRPRQLDIVRANASGGNAAVALSALFDWRGVTVGDVTGGAQDDILAEYSPGLAEEWLSDRLDLLLPLWEEVQKLIEAHAEALEAARKNS